MKEGQMFSVSKMAPTIFCESIMLIFIMETTLKLITNDIAIVDLYPKSYPTTHSMTDIDSQLTFVPASFQMFLRPIIKTDESVSIWGQNFIKACRPRSGVLIWVKMDAQQVPPTEIH